MAFSAVAQKSGEVRSAPSVLRATSSQLALPVIAWLLGAAGRQSSLQFSSLHLLRDLGRRTKSAPFLLTALFSLLTLAAGITALALATAPELAPALQVLPLPESLHGPLHQRMVLLKGASPAAVAWHQFLLSPQARAVFLRHGYALPQ